MTVKKHLVETLIKSLTDEWQDWSFGEHTAANSKRKVEIWIKHGLLGISIYLPTEIEFSFFDRWKIYKAMDECRSRYIINKLNPMSASA